MSRAGRHPSARWAIAGLVLAALAGLALGLTASAHGARARRGARRVVLHHRPHRRRAAPGPVSVLRVGTYNGLAGQYTDLQDAINAAKPGDWVLIAPGDYKESGNQTAPGAMGDDKAGAEFLVQTNDLHLRGMDRNTVWLDGTKPGTPMCSDQTADQNFGPSDSNNQPSGRNGIIVYKASGVSLENFSACNDLTGDNGGGDEIWFDGGGSSGKEIAMSFRGAYLTASSTYFVNNDSPAAGYGIYSSNTKGGPGLFVRDYASNMNDSAYYVGGCPDCAVTLDEVQGEDSPLGYSGTNSGGDITVEYSEFDNNKDGFDTNSQNNDDAPSPQDGGCPAGATNPSPPPNTQRSHSCWVFTHNYVHDNNNPNVPEVGAAAAGPTGTGISISGGRHDIVTDNRFVNNGAWGILLVPYPDTETPPSDIGQDCQGGTKATVNGEYVCYFEDYANEIANNSFTNNGWFGNQTNGDIAEISGGSPNTFTDGNCFHDNTDTSGTLTSDPSNIDSDNQCGSDYNGEPLESPLGAQVACDTAFFVACPNTGVDNYPQTTNVVLKLPPAQTSMPNPCVDVPANPWCPASVHGAKAKPTKKKKIKKKKKAK